jgi:outer membrane protein OmpA-like peptidoglycan-associated protein
MPEAELFPLIKVPKMIRRRHPVLLALSFAIALSLVQIAPASDKTPGFADSAEEITRALSTPAAASLPVRTRGLRPASAKPPTRAIRVMVREGGQAVFKQARVVEGQPGEAGVNLKIEFDVGSHAIRPESFGLLEELARALQSDTLKARAVLIRGHTDSDGDRDSNLALSLRRAEAVREYLLAGFGIDGERIQVEGWGEEHPLAANDCPANKQLNRRVEIVSQP